jgi:copper chaperone CopZ
MKKWMIFSGLLFIAGWAHAQIQSAKLQASGLTCAMCARAVYKNLEALPFVQSIDTDLNGSAFLLSFNEKAVDPDAIRKKVEDAGFSVADLVLTARFEPTTIEADKHIDLQGLMFHFVGGRKSELNGVQNIRLVDRHFIPAKEAKKVQSLTKLDCYNTGIMGDCCNSKATSVPRRVYHLMLVP